MARIEKYSSGIVGVIKHNIREFKDGICPTNMEVDPSKSGDNYSILRRGDTAKEIERYRKQLMKEVFHYKRKNIVLCNEVVCTLPSDCPPEQEKAFFEETFKYICSTLPMGEKSVLLAEVHRDEGHVLKDGKTVAEGAAHLHVMYVPAVKDTKHKGFSFRLCSDELTKRAVLKQWHPNYQKWLENAGVHATVASGVTSGRGMSVRSLKELSRETGMTLDHVMDLAKENQRLQQQVLEQSQTINMVNDLLARKDAELEHAMARIKELESEHTHTHTWGANSNWGTQSITIQEEKLW